MQRHARNITALLGFSHVAGASLLAVDDHSTPSPHQQTPGFCFVLLLANSAVEVLLAQCGQWKNPHPDVTFRELERRRQWAEKSWQGEGSTFLSISCLVKPLPGLSIPRNVLIMLRKLQCWSPRHGLRNLCCNHVYFPFFFYGTMSTDHRLTPVTMAHRIQPREPWTVWIQKKAHQHINSSESHFLACCLSREIY